MECYDLLEPLGKGTFGVVVAARHRHTGTQVVGLGQGPGRWESYWRDARRLAGAAYMVATRPLNPFPCFPATSAGGHQAPQERIHII